MTTVMTDLFTAALRRRVATPAGARLKVSSCGRSFYDIDIDRWPIDDNWPEPAASALQELARLLAQPYVCRTGRAAFTSGFRSVGYVYAPRACARALLDVLLSAEHGDDSRVREAIAVLEPVVAGLQGHRTHAARRRAAAVALDELALS